MDRVEAAKRYPCAKKAWLEFLGGEELMSTEDVIARYNSELNSALGHIVTLTIALRVEHVATSR